MKRLLPFLFLLGVTSTGLTMLEGANARAQATMDAGSAATTSNTAALTGSGSAMAGSGDTVTVTTTTTMTADKLHDPMVDPIGAFDDLKAAKKVNWPLALLAGLILLTKGLATASKKWPSFSGFSWLNKGKVAVVVAGILTVAVAAFNSLALGGTWFAVMSAAAATLFSLMVPTHTAPADPKAA